MSIFKELEQVIAEFVGYKEDGVDFDEETGQTFPYFDCADIDLYNKIVDECTKHLNKKVPLKFLSKDAQVCIGNWEDLIKNYSSYNEQFKR